MKVGDLVFRKKCDVLDNLYHISDYCYDSDGTMVNLKDSIGVVVTKDRYKPNPWKRYRIGLGTSWDTGNEENWPERDDTMLVDDSKVWVAWTPEIKSLEWTDDLKTFDEDDLDPFAEDETDG